jgi:hypothetical protein
VRTVTGPELTQLLSATSFNVYTRVWVANADGTWKNLTSLSGFDFLLDLEVDVDIDQPVAEAIVHLKRDIGALSLSPFREDSALNRRDDGVTYANLIDPGRDFYIETAIAAPGVGPSNWKEIFAGIIDSVDAATDVLEFRGRDLGAYIADAWFSDAVARTWDGVPIEEVIQSTLDEGGMDGRVTTVALFTPTSPDFLITAFKYDIEPVLDAVVRLAQVIGWDVRYRYDDTTLSWRFTFQDPDRTKSVPDATIGPSQYLDVTDLKLDRTNVRNSVTVEWGPPNARRSMLYEDGVSISRFKKRPVVLKESSDSAIDSADESDALGAAVLADLAWPKAEQSIEMLYFWPVELQDLYRFTANGVHYSVNEDLAVVRYRHMLGRNGGKEHRTLLDVRGAPSGGYALWLARAAKPRDPTYGTPVPTIGPVTTEGTARDGHAEAAMHIPIRFEPNTAQVLIYASEAPFDPANPPPAPELDANSLSATVLRHEGQIAAAVDWLTEVDISTTFGFARRIIALPVGPTGIRGIPFIAHALCEDTGTAPTAPPDSLNVVVSVVAGVPQAVLTWANGDIAAETRVWRNGIVLTRVDPGVNTLTDIGIATDREYDYKVQHIRDAQTSEYAGFAGVVSGSPTLAAPTWVGGYPQNGGYDSPLLIPPPNGLVRIRVSNPDPAAETWIYINNQDAIGGVYTVATILSPGVTTVTLNAADMPGSPTDHPRWFYLEAHRAGYTTSAASSIETASFSN